MAESTEKVDVWEEVFNRIDEFALKLEELTKTYSGDVVELTLSVVRFEGVADILTGVMCLLISIAFLFGVRFGVSYHNESNTLKEPYKSDKNEVFGMISMLGGGLVSLITFISALIFLLRPWSWIAMFEPKIALARNVLKSVLGM